MIKQANSRLAYMTTRINKENDRDYYGTPKKYVDMASKVMGGIELDPASCHEANERFIKAWRFWDEEANGLEQSWESESLWLNPPYSRTGCRDFAFKFRDECELGNIKQSIVLVNSATGTQAFRAFFDNSIAICFCNKRIQFLDPSGNRSQSSNSKEQLFFYRGRRVKKFARVFGEIGRIVTTNVN